MALQFTDQQFQEAWKELDEPQIGGEWEFFTETMGVKIYRRFIKETGLYEYKVFGSLSTCSPDLCADVYMDLAYRKHWDDYAKELYEKDYGGQKAIYWEVKYPFPLSNRDYVYVRERRELEVNGRKIWVVLAKSSAVSQCPEKAGVIRVKDYKQSVAMESDGANGTKDAVVFAKEVANILDESWIKTLQERSPEGGLVTTNIVFMNYFDNPGGKIPTWLVNWAAKTGVPAFLTDMQKACNNYANYCKNKK